MPETEKTQQTKDTCKIKNNQGEIYVNVIEPSELKKDDLILDIRTYLNHAKIALNRPHWHISAEDINPAKFIKDYHLDGSKTLNIICTSGRKSTEMARKFIQAGFNNVTSVIGGIQHAKEEGLDMIEHPVWDIPTQVHFSAGLLILLGCLLGWGISTLFFFIPLIVGIGLIVSAVTGNCTLAKILNEMPWNK